MSDRFAERQMLPPPEAMSLSGPDSGLFQLGTALGPSLVSWPCVPSNPTALGRRSCKRRPRANFLPSSFLFCLAPEDALSLPTSPT